MSVISDPGTVKWICGKGADGFRLSNLHLRVLSPSLGNGLIVAEDEDWRAQRRISTRLLSRKSFDDPETTAMVEARIDELLQKFRQQNNAINVLPELLKTIVDILIIYSINKDHVRVDDELVGQIDLHRSVIENFDHFDAMGVPASFISKKMRDAKAAASSFNEQIERELATLDTAWSSSIANVQNVSKRDFIVSILTGFESVAVSCTWALATLSMHPDLQDRLRSSSGVSKSPMLGATEKDRFILEVLRLYPPLPLIYRQATRSHETAVGVIKRGELVCISPWIIHRHNMLWTHPNKFDPDRWQHNKASELEQYLPFGVGARQCVGMHLGLFLLSLLTTRILHRFQIRSPEKSLPSPRAGVSLRPINPVRIEFTGT